MKNYPIIKEVSIPVKSEVIWEALTNPVKMKEWYFEVIDFKLEKGKVFYFYEPGNAKKFRHECRIIEIIPNLKFQHTWSFPDYSPGESILTWELNSSDSKTQIKLTHEGIENFSNAGSDFARANFEAGWEEIVTKILVNYLIP